MPTPSSPENQARLYFMDGIRVLDTLAVVFIHAAFAFSIQSIYQWPLKDPAASKFLGYVLLLLNQFAMPLFFLLAGFFARQTYIQTGYSSFIRSRLLRVGLPFLIGMLVLTFLNTLEMLSALANTPAIIQAINNQQFSLTLLGEQLAGKNYLSYYNYTSYLWFLYILLIFYALTLLGLGGKKCVLSSLSFIRMKSVQTYFAKLSGKIADNCNNRLLNPFLLALIIAFILIPSPDNSIIPPLKFTVPPHTLLGYAVYFYFGWLINPHPEKVFAHARKNCWRYFSWQFIFFLPCYLILQAHQDALADNALIYSIKRFALIYCYALGSWLSIYCLLGFFIKYCNKKNALVRYVSDACYWIYLIQIPIIVYLQIKFIATDYMLSIKALSVFLGTLFFALLSYQLLVRHTFIGWVLHGRKQKLTLKINPRLKVH